MQTREELRRQLAVAGDLHAVVGTMKGLAAVTIHQFEEALAALDDYVATVELGVQVVLAPGGAAMPAPVERTRLGIVAFGSDQGLCGSLNRVVADAVVTRLDQAPRETRDWIMVCGERLASELEAGGLHPAARHRAPASAPAITEVVDELLVAIEEWSRQGLRIVLVTPRPTASAARYEPVDHQLVPLDPARLARLARRPWPSRRLPSAVGEPRAVLRALTRALLAVDLHRALAETAVAVHGSRLAAMQAAERAIDERIEDLQRAHHRVRQAQITEELHDVVAGFETIERG